MLLIDPRTFWVFFVLVTVLVLGLAAGSLPQSEEARLALLAFQQFLFIFGGLAGARKEVFRPLDGKTFFRSFLKGVGLYVVNTALGMVSYGIALRLFDHDLVHNQILSERSGVEVLLTSNKPLVFFGIVLLLTLGAPLGEELFFRGLLVDLWKERFGAKKAIFFSALLFALLHFYVLQFIPVLVAGILLGILFVRSENVFVSIIAHSTVNILVLLFWLFGL